MRPPRVQRSSLRYPLDEVLGTLALVRLLRVLVHDVDGPVGVTDAARMAGLSTTGARKSLETLERLGVAARVGTGRAQKFGPRGDRPYLADLRRLFAQEQEEYDRLVEELRGAVSMPEIRDAWVRDVVRGPARALELDIVAETRAIGRVGSDVRTRVAEAEQRFDVVIEINVFTRADAVKPPEDAIVIRSSGTMVDVDRPLGARTGAESEERSLAAAEVITDLIRRDPSLLRRALRHTERLLREGQGTADSDIGEWRQLLETYSPERVRDLLVSRSPRADRLRRSSPFLGVLSPEERARVLQAMASVR